MKRSLSVCLSYLNIRIRSEIKRFSVGLSYVDSNMMGWGVNNVYPLVFDPNMRMKQNVVCPSVCLKEQYVRMSFEIQI